MTRAVQSIRKVPTVTVTQILMLAIISVVVTIPIVMLIPRARQSRDFDRILWIASLVLAFLGAWGAPGFIPADLPLSNVVVLDLPIVQVVIGALAGALSINVLLWILDRFERPAPEVEPYEEESNASEESDHLTHTNPSDQ